MAGFLLSLKTFGSSCDTGSRCGAESDDAAYGKFMAGAGGIECATNRISGQAEQPLSLSGCIGIGKECLGGTMLAQVGAKTLHRHDIALGMFAGEEFIDRKRGCDNSCVGIGSGISLRAARCSYTGSGQSQCGANEEMCKLHFFDL